VGEGWGEGVSSLNVTPLPETSLRFVSDLSHKGRAKTTARAQIQFSNSYFQTHVHAFRGGSRPDHA
jgi:hypothetical protein